MTRLRLRLRRARGESGFTLIEMMIATALLSLVTASAFGVINVMSNQAAQTGDRYTAIGQAQTMADRITKDIRTAVAPTSTTAAFASASSNDVVFYASLSDLSLPQGTGPIRLHAYITLVPGTTVYVFHEDATPPDTPYTGTYTYTGTPVNRIDGQYIDSTQPIFSYWDSNGNPIPVPVAAARLADIDSVGISLRVRVHLHSPTVVISTQVHIRNVDYNPNN